VPWGLIIGDLFEKAGDAPPRSSLDVCRVPLFGSVLPTGKSWPCRIEDLAREIEASPRVTEGGEALDGSRTLAEEASA
jgi:hypothetical protein